MVGQARRRSTLRGDEHGARVAYAVDSRGCQRGMGRRSSGGEGLSMAGLTDRQRIVLDFLERHYSRPMAKAIATHTGSRSVGGVTRTLWCMEELGLVSRNIHQQWSITRKGRETLGRRD